MKKPLYLIDGYSLIYRTYFALIRSPLMTSQGKNRNVVFGFFNSLFSFIKKFECEKTVVAMDSRTKTFRHEFYPEYKATREKAPEDLHEQIPIVEEILSALGIPILRVDGYEADDLIASLANRCKKEGRPCRILSGDKDLCQLIGEGITLLRPSSAGDYEEMTREKVKEHYGVYPEQILDYLSLMGDTADNIPGVTKVGKVTAAKWLEAYGTMDALYEHLDEIKGKARENLENDREKALLSRRLVTLKDDLEIPLDIEALDTSSPNMEAALVIFRREEIRKFGSPKAAPAAEPNLFSAVPAAAVDAPAAHSRSSATAAADSPGNGSAGTAGSAAASSDAVAGNAPPETFAPGSVTIADTPEKAAAWIRKAADAGVFAFDSETTGLDTFFARPVGFSLAVDGGSAVYIPLIADGVPVQDENRIRGLLKPLLENENHLIIGHNLKYDYQVLKRWGITLKPGFDTMIAAWLYDSMLDRFQMDFLALRLLNYQPISYKEIVPKERHIGEIPLSVCADYAGEDAFIAYRFYEFLKPKLDESGLTKSFYETEMKIAVLLAETEMRGIGIDCDELDRYGDELTAEADRLEKEIFKEVGFEFNLKSVKQLQSVLFETLGLKPTKKTSGGAYSTDSAVLQELVHIHRVPKLLLDYRACIKLNDTYAQALPKLVNPETGRIYPTFQQTGTATGRLSCRNPNLQNIPIRDEAGRRIRSAFKPEKGFVFVSADYSQIELVMLAAFSGDPGLCEAFRNGIDVHARTASLLFGTPLEQVSPDQRRIAKTINFGIMYGMSAFRLSNELEIPFGRANDFIRSYFTTFGGVKAFLAKVIGEAEATGEVRMISGRRRRIFGIASRNKTERNQAERVALNTLIQGSAADVVKTAMLNVDRMIRESGSGARLLLQIHDELLFEVPESEASLFCDRLKREMETAVTLPVPLRASVETGLSWGEIH